MQNKIFIDGKEINIIIEYKNVKNINLRIKETSVVHISCSYKVSYKAIEDALYKNKDWIIKNTINREQYILDEDKILYLGKYYNLKIILSNIDKISILEQYIIIYSKENTREYINSLIEKWYYREASIILFNEIESLSKRLAIYPNKVYIGNQKTLWGSCNSKKHIRLNWRLVLMPKSVRYYIIIHELCHIIYMNHSSDFWMLVNKYDPKYKENKLWIKENGKKLINIY